jgi:hypothetical protein
MMRHLVKDLGSARRWTAGPPEWIDHTNEEVDNTVDEPARTVGGVLELFSALPPWGDRLSPEVDRAQYDEVTFLVGLLSDFSKSTGQQICIELEGTQVGWIERGVPDEGIEKGLLSEWERALGGQR